MDGIVMVDHMRMMFLDEDGAVTVDWVVLTAFVIALNIGLIINLLESGVNVGASGIYDAISSVTP